MRFTVLRASQISPLTRFLTCFMQGVCRPLVFDQSDQDQHFSFWESADVISFILRQVTLSGQPNYLDDQITNFPSFPDNQHSSSSAQSAPQGVVPNQAREKWIKKRTAVKIRNGAANHRGNDVIVLEGRDQVLHGRFSYGPFDMSVLSGEKVSCDENFAILFIIYFQVDIHIMKEPPNGEWTLLSSQLTDKTGRITYKASLRIQTK